MEAPPLKTSTTHALDGRKTNGIDGREVAAERSPRVAAIIGEIEVAGGGAEGEAIALEVERVAQNDIVG